MNIKNICLTALALIICVSAQAKETVKEEIPLPHKVENVTIKDLYGNPTQLPYFGEKNLLIFYVDPDAYLAMNKNNKFAEELEENGRAAGPAIYGFGILNFPDTWLPKNMLRKICRKRVERNGATIIDDSEHIFKNSWGLGDCGNKFMLIVVSKEGEIVHIVRDEIDKKGKEEFYKIIDKYRF
uniref:hypothetical protein n=1 Tax=Alistipes sp. TaxID=1872444 RepID=UPI0040578337